MADIEKVIKGLEELEGFLFKEYTNIKAEESKIYYDRFKSLSDAIDLLKEQEAVEPYVTGRGETFETAETWWYECGNCNKPIDPNDKYCRHCGRSVKWNEMD